MAGMEAVPAIVAAVRVPARRNLVTLCMPAVAAVRVPARRNLVTLCMPAVVAVRVPVRHRLVTRCMPAVARVMSPRGQRHHGRLRDRVLVIRLCGKERVTIELCLSTTPRTDPSAAEG
jgi:hypothetical protein